MQSYEQNENITDNNGNDTTIDYSDAEVKVMGLNVTTLKPSSTPATELTTTGTTTTTTSLIPTTTTTTITELKPNNIDYINQNSETDNNRRVSDLFVAKKYSNANAKIYTRTNSKSASCVKNAIIVANPFASVTNNVSSSSSTSMINPANNKRSHFDFIANPNPIPNPANNSIKRSHFNFIANPNPDSHSSTKVKCVPQATTSILSSSSLTARTSTMNSLSSSTRWSRSECCHPGLSNQTVPHPPERRVTAYERLTIDLETNPKSIRELSLGKRIGLYRIRGELGSGNFSSVKLGIHTLVKEKVAIKILDKTRLDLKTQRLLSREIEIMEQLRHPNIIRLYEVVETLAKVHLIMEYAAGGELFTKLSNEGRMTEPEAKFIFAQIVSAVEHMHNNHVIHRDLKAENVFYAAPFLVKVGDFGFSTMCRTKQQALNTFCGSPPYAAPELFRDDTYYGTFVDIWALGILLYFMVTGSMPFRAENVTRMKKCILTGTYAIPMVVSDSCHFLIRGILRSFPKDRFTIEEIKNSEWLSSEAFPKPLPLYRLCPNANLSDLKDDEREAVKALTQLGITKEHFQQAINKNTRNCIIGAYRIMLHRVQKRDQEKDLYAMAEFSSRLFKPHDNRKKMRTHISKLCIIL